MLKPRLQGAARRAHGSSALVHAMRDLIASNALLREGTHKARPFYTKTLPRGSNGDRSPLGTPFFHIFRRATKDMAAGGRRLTTAARKNAKIQRIAKDPPQSPARVFSLFHAPIIPRFPSIVFHYFSILQKFSRKFASKPSPRRLNSVQRRRKPLQRPVPPPVDHGFFQFQLLAEPIQISPPRLHVHPPQHQPLRLTQGR